MTRRCAREIERPSDELDVARRARSRAITVAISRVETASVKPAARSARTAASIARSDCELQPLAATCGRSPGGRRVCGITQPARTGTVTPGHPIAPDAVRCPPLTFRIQSLALDLPCWVLDGRPWLRSAFGTPDTGIAPRRAGCRPWRSPVVRFVGSRGGYSRSARRAQPGRLVVRSDLVARRNPIPAARRRLADVP